MPPLQKSVFSAIAFVILCIASAQITKADPVVLVNGTPTDLSGTGFGTRLTILSLHNTPSETGATTFANPDGTGHSTNQDSLLSVAQLNTLGINNASNFGMIWNTNETGSNPGANLIGSGPSGLVLTFYNLGGGVVATAVIDPSLLVGGEFVRDPFNQGNGGSGYLFTLGNNDPATVAAINALLASGQGWVGLSASINNTDDGADSFFVLRVSGTTPDPVPEPATMILLGTGLAAVGGYVRKRRAGKS